MPMILSNSDVLPWCDVAQEGDDRRPRLEPSGIVGLLVEFAEQLRFEIDRLLDFKIQP